jgi:hypothetical protein
MRMDPQDIQRFEAMWAILSADRPEGVSLHRLFQQAVALAGLQDIVSLEEATHIPRRGPWPAPLHRPSNSISTPGSTGLGRCSLNPAASAR